MVLSRSMRLNTSRLAQILSNPKKRTMAAAFAAIAVKQQSTETNINTDVCGYLQPIAIFYIVGNIVRKIAAIEQVEVHFKILVGSEVVLEVHAKRNAPVSGTTHPAFFQCDTVNRFILIV